MSHRAVFFDRDGTLIQAAIVERRAHPPSTLDDVQFVEGARETCLSLRQAGFLVVGITNQPDVKRGIQRYEVVEQINDFVRLSLELDGILTCYHDEIDNCYCRKPRPGLLFTAARQFGISLPSSYMVGDRWKDIDAGKHAGCKTIWLQSDYQEAPPDSPTFAATNLTTIGEWILSDSAPQ